METPIDFSTLNPAQTDAFIEQLLERVYAHTQQDQELQLQLKLNSCNSSKPSSNDGYDKSKPKSTRAKSCKRLWGQSGHAEKTLKKTVHLDHIVDQAPVVCTSCGLELRATPVLGFEAFQVFDFSPIKIEATAHRAQIKACRSCQSRNRAAFAEHVNQPMRYGTEVQCMVSYLASTRCCPTHGSRRQWPNCFRSISARGQ